MLNFDDYAGAALLMNRKRRGWNNEPNRTSRRKYSEPRPCSVSMRQLFFRDKRGA